MSELTLFDTTPYLVPAARGLQRDKMSAGRRLTMRQVLDLAKGRHPLTGGPLHELAAPAGDRAADGLRCGTCMFRAPIGGHTRAYPKCWWPNEGGGPFRGTPLRVTHGPATDVRGWWPACADYEERSEP